MPAFSNPHQLRQAAYDAWSGGNLEKARSLLDEAITQDPYHPIQYELRRKLQDEVDSR
jgi:hypothetical protein